MYLAITVKDFAEQIKSGFYAWPGGYPLYALTSDGAVLCGSCCKSEARQIVPAIKTDLHNGWRVEAFSINYEEEYLYCDHCSAHIESAYGES